MMYRLCIIRQEPCMTPTADVCISVLSDILDVIIQSSKYILGILINPNNHRHT